MKRNCFLLFIALGMLPLTAVAQKAAAPLQVGHGPQRGPAEPREFISANDIAKRIAEADAAVASGKMYSGEPLLLQGGYRVTMEWRNIAQNTINAHLDDAEMFVILEGSGAMEFGGTLVNPHAAGPSPYDGPTMTATSAQGSTIYKVAKGDMIMIPKNTPHRVSQVDGGKLVLWSMILPTPAPEPEGTASASPARAGMPPRPPNAGGGPQRVPGMPLQVGHGPNRGPAEPHMFTSASDIADRIAAADAAVASGKMYSGEPLLLQGSNRVTMEWRNISQNTINAHLDDEEMFVILEGSGMMELGGTLVDPHAAGPSPYDGPTMTATTAQGSTLYKVTKGDMIMIPKNTPHRVSQLDGSKLVLWSMILPPPASEPASGAPAPTPAAAPAGTVTPQ